ncbi:MAG: carbamoyltransferase HypF [Caldimicrobium sp.]|nr:carbamoyltransferase HypF [Caldimicrobium sp.]MCX7873659.1 carbamoyltransferase HypF [Caldimicrobium sp.]MDW8094350.1 carbamoyltransferase HypF [Caldimicrobium sp.]
MKSALRIEIRGVVQGVGFRPALYRIASSLSLKGQISNTSKGVLLLLEGEKENLEALLRKIPLIKPPLARIEEFIIDEIPPQNFKDLKITKGESDNQPALDPLPDLSVCEECLKELFDPTNRRYLYPFITCTQCGPRFSIMENLPYERENTTMKTFEMCELCKEEYENPLDRRFHAEPTACPFCGPILELYNEGGEKIAENQEALKVCAQYLKEGKIIALMGLTGFHLLVRADREEDVAKLRKRKLRPHKPLAVMFRDIDHLKGYISLEEKDETLLRSPASPILILRGNFSLPSILSGGLNSIGVFISYTPLHRLLFAEIDFPLVATSGNITKDPIIFKADEALDKLKGIADFFLVHNRPIHRPLDDSVFKKIGSEYIPIRIARGYSPLTVLLKHRVPKVILAVGAQERNTFAIVKDKKIVISPFIGDLDNPNVLARFERYLEDFVNFYSVEPEVIVVDLHPQYQSTKFAEALKEKRGIPIIRVQHHHAHILSVMAENQVPPEEEILGVAWDGTGYGLDHTVWGGEFLLVRGTQFQRVATLRSFKLLGGEKAVKDTRRVALSLLLEIYGEEIPNLDIPLIKTFSAYELTLLIEMWKKGINSPLCSSVGRLLDGISALLGICYYNTYSGEAATRLESLYDWTLEDSYPFSKENFYFDWAPLIVALIESKENLDRKVSRCINALANIIREVAKSVALRKVVLSGGVFMNEPLLIRSKALLKKEGFEVLINQRVPPNDSGLSLGQAYYAVLTFSS